MDAVENAADIGWRHELRGVRFGLSSATESFAEVAGHDFAVDLLPAALAEETETIFGHGEMADLPGEVRGAARGQPVPVGLVRFGQKTERVIASEFKLLDC